MGRDIIIEEEGIGGIVLYQTPDGQTNLEVELENDTVWLTRQQMALLFGVSTKCRYFGSRNIGGSDPSGGVRVVE